MWSNPNLRIFSCCCSIYSVVLFFLRFLSFFLRLLLILLPPSATGPPKRQCWCDGVWIRGRRLLSWQLTNLPLFWFTWFPWYGPAATESSTKKKKKKTGRCGFLLHISRIGRPITTTKGAVDMFCCLSNKSGGHCSVQLQNNNNKVLLAT